MTNKRKAPVLGPSVCLAHSGSLRLTGSGTRSAPAVGREADSGRGRGERTEEHRTRHEPSDVDPAEHLLTSFLVDSGRESEAPLTAP